MRILTLIAGLLFIFTCTWSGYKRSHGIEAELADCPYFSMDSTITWLVSQQQIPEFGNVEIAVHHENNIQFNDFLLLEINFPRRTYILYSKSQAYPPVMEDNIKEVFRKRLKHEW